MYRSVEFLENRLDKEKGHPIKGRLKSLQPGSVALLRFLKHFVEVASMHRTLCVLLLSLLMCCPAFARSGSHPSSHYGTRTARAPRSESSVHVRGYTRRDGTYVAPSTRSGGSY